MKHIVIKTMNSVKSKLNAKKRKGCFELFGYDFMVDHDLTVWLIECNTNPCLDESSLILKCLLPRMLDDAFKLTIDKDYQSPIEEKIRELTEIKNNNYTKLVADPEHRKFGGVRKLNSGLDLN